MNLSNITDLKSTILGLAMGFGQYWFMVGEKIPETPAEWVSFVLGVVMVVGGAGAPNSIFSKR